MNFFIGFNITLMLLLILIYKGILYFGGGSLFIGVHYMIAKFWLLFVGPIVASILNFFMLLFIEEPTKNLHFVLLFLSIPVITVIFLLFSSYLNATYLSFHERKIKKTVINYLKEMGVVDVYSINKVLLLKKKVYTNKLILKVENEEKHHEYKSKCEKDLRDRLYNEYEIQILFSNERS